MLSHLELIFGLCPLRLSRLSLHLYLDGSVRDVACGGR